MAPRVELPPGQYLTTFLPPSTEHAPEIPLSSWTFTLSTENGAQRVWDWPGFGAMPTETCCVDLHSEEGWSILGSTWEGVPISALLADLPTSAEFAHIHGYGGVSTTLPLEDLTEMPTWIAVGYQSRPIPAQLGGPARLLVPHLYLFKSLPWVRAITLSDHDEPGTRERGGLHHYGDPWREQRRR